MVYTVCNREEAWESGVRMTMSTEGNRLPGGRHTLLACAETEDFCAPFQHKML